MTIQVSAFRWVPDFAQGFVRDLRVRWALEEAGLPYEAVLIDQDIKATPDYRAWQPFGQVPAYYYSRAFCGRVSPWRRSHGDDGRWLGVG